MTKLKIALNLYMWWTKLKYYPNMHNIIYKFSSLNEWFSWHSNYIICQNITKFTCSFNNIPSLWSINYTWRNTKWLLLLWLQNKTYNIPKEMFLILLKTFFSLLMAFVQTIHTQDQAWHLIILLINILKSLLLFGPLWPNLNSLIHRLATKLEPKNL